MQDYVTIACPYCGEPVDLRIDVLPEPQEYIEDCAVCCRPIEVRVQPAEEDAPPHVFVRSGNAI
ncbi:CPXCG motif-containing cysteine-rich protein [Marilutibacter chinensis]|uniref:CPXCG motif-containing cysteine-rich protein n=1 Tax=Marilutibacter chinensis TaxID=2912247 RepID=A0ABS9HRW6_9GAMM|nr:CPXCG motif-containing cysteine-rich protein [Lysobacter chinensis]MCF7221408.1 CPXCG motif-containing cysteine-rich protein [Lysobacter chinensis]